MMKSDQVLLRVIVISC